MKAEYADNWEMLFDIGELGYPIDQPLTQKILSDPFNPITRRILYLYSMESFIYADLNKVCREKDRSKIKYYGAFAAGLSFILDNANRNLRIGKS